MDSTKFDKRTIDRNLKSGAVSQKEYEKHLSKLADLAEETEIIDVPLYPWEVEEAERKAKEEAEQKAMEEAEQESTESEEQSGSLDEVPGESDPLME
ncbi:MAG: hypothetical protein GY762_22710 [Proteobacteria bacterium]|nr:hypothetical protein [Pseudomonadota bacterium]